jgi:thioesterase domain-containing protein
MIYENTAKALGGKEKWEKIESLYVEGKWSIPHGEDIAFIYKTLNPDLNRFDFVYMGGLHTIANFGHKGWVNDPTGQIEGYERMETVEKVASRNAFLYENNFVNYEEKGLEIKFEGSVTIEDEELWLVRVLGFRDKEELYFISSGDYLPVIKQTYYFRKGLNAVVNYHITSYMNTGGLMVPREVLVQAQDLNLILSYSSYVPNYELERSDFQDPNQPDYTTNILSFSQEEAQDYLHTEIPITRKMGIEVQSLSNNDVRLMAPIAENANHFKSAFGGSVDSLFLTAGWAYIRLVVNHIEPMPTIVGSKAKTVFSRPITEDFTASLTIPDKKEVDEFLKRYDRFGRSRIKLKAVIKKDGNTYASFEGEYVIVKSEQSLSRN